MYIDLNKPLPTKSSKSRPAHLNSNIRLGKLPYPILYEYVQFLSKIPPEIAELASTAGGEFAYRQNIGIAVGQANNRALGFLGERVSQHARGQRNELRQAIYAGLYQDLEALESCVSSEVMEIVVSWVIEEALGMHPPMDDAFANSYLVAKLVSRVPLVHLASHLGSVLSSHREWLKIKDQVDLPDVQEAMRTRLRGILNQEQAADIMAALSNPDGIVQEVRIALTHALLNQSDSTASDVARQATALINLQRIVDYQQAGSKPKQDEHYYRKLSRERLRKLAMRESYDSAEPEPEPEPSQVLLH